MQFTLCEQSMKFVYAWFYSVSQLLRKQPKFLELNSFLQVPEGILAEFSPCVLTKIHTQMSSTYRSSTV